MDNLNILKHLGLPILKSKEDLATSIQIPKGYLEDLSWTTRYRYKTREIKKKSGGTRVLCEPSESLKGIQAWVLRNILDSVRPHPCATAFIKGKRIKDTLNPHIFNRYFLCLDIEDFFGSISFKRVFYLFNSLGYPRDVSWTLTALCTYKGSLPQGGVTSPSISNMIGSSLDRRLQGFCSRNNIIYTRYCDDLCFSARRPEILCNKKKMIENIIVSERFKLNEGKTRLMGPRSGVKILGLSKQSDKIKISVSKKKRREMRKKMFLYKKFRVLDDEYDCDASFEGWLAFLKGVDISAYNNLNNYWKYLSQAFP